MNTVKSLYTNFKTYIALIFLASLVSTTSTAGALFVDPLEKNTPAPTKRSEPMGTAVGGAGNVTPLSGDAKQTQKLSCWQNGDLIFELPVIAPKDKVTDIRLLRSTKSGIDMLALDFKNAFCFIK